MPKSIFINTPIYYVNGLPHVGSALTTISCDVLARYHRLRGEEAFLLTGTDENATKVQAAAEKAGVPPMEFVDKLADEFRACWDGLNIAYDDFIRTTEPRHIRAVQVFFDKLIEKGHVYLDTYEGWYSGFRRDLLSRYRCRERHCQGERQARRTREGGELFLPSFRPSGIACFSISKKTLIG